ncbi:MAG: hypothetical protein JRN06_13090 [Nitrososphaerota archaeon]|nr:hypothetical protein [Nitrososphaerota archaeon]
MTDFAWLFLYTPVPYLAAMYLVTYRHDLGRLAKPFRDCSSESEWYSVCRCLGLAGVDLRPPEKPLLGSTRNLLLLIASLTIYAASGYASSLLLAWYYLCAIQAAVAAPLFVLLVLNWTGPFPFKPYRDVLPYPRLGTRIRHLGRSNEPKPPNTAVSTTGETR